MPPRAWVSDTNFGVLALLVGANPKERTKRRRWSLASSFAYGHQLHFGFTLHGKNLPFGSRGSFNSTAAAFWDVEVFSTQHGFCRLSDYIVRLGG